MNTELLGPLVAWPLMLLAAWSAGEWAFRHWNLPRVAAYRSEERRVGKECRL